MSASEGGSRNRAATGPGLDLRLLSMVFILVAMWIFFRVQVGDFYFSGESIAKLSRDMATWTILAAGMTLVIVSGHIDLSVGSLMALVVACCALMIDPEDGLGWSAGVAVPLALGVGLTLGLWQGALVAHFRIPAFIVTLSGLFIFRGLTQRVSARDPRVPDESWVTGLGFNYLSPTVGYVLAGGVCLAIAGAVGFARARRRRLGLAAGGVLVSVLTIAVPCVLIFGFVWKVNQYRGVPAQTVTMAIVMGVMYFLSRKTRFGRHVFAIGGNAEAARLSGVSVERNTIAVFGLMGLLAGVAGVVWMAQNQGATQKAGEWYELYAIAACVIGGTSLMGGRGSVFGTLLGALVMATVVQGMDYTGLENWIQLAVRGAVLGLAVGIDVAGKDPAPWMLRLRRRLQRQPT
ncbi:MAG: sugar ABC transporter permease [Verrucomicrobia bacterium]|nr:sugar ABC transporter permease [Verrucomicrobiota bacterium]MDA1087761.1 sugar ABC transporter permease [Verrucomicrobiota bacterium]